MTDSFAAFLNARVRGMKSGLVQRHDLDEYLEAVAVETILESLLSSPYETEVAEALTRYKGADALEDAVSRNLIRTFAKLRGFCRGRYLELAEIFIGRWDLIAVKALLRNRHHQLDLETGAGSLFPGPSMSPALQRELASQPTMEALVQGLIAWNSRLCGPLMAALPDYQKTNDVRPLEEAVDRGYFVGNVRRLSGRLDSDSRFLKRLLQLEIDRINLRLLFSPRDPGTPPEDLVQRLLPRGTLSNDLLRSIASAATPERAVEMLEKTEYGTFGEALEQFSLSGRFGRLERMFESAFMQRLRRAAMQQGIGIAVLMRYAWLKYNEVINLRIIVRGLAVQLPKARIEEEVVYVF